ncbi:hypothetical protein NOVOSPHI9U_20076 [Novosphingobium sp. 9U]|nr:hypothetical protein NOVOSPHI9U_20076 [Novosphingobium sp. 9U]
MIWALLVPDCKLFLTSDIGSRGREPKHVGMEPQACSADVVQKIAGDCTATRRDGLTLWN